MINSLITISRDEKNKIPRISLERTEQNRNGGVLGMMVMLKFVNYTDTKSENRWLNQRKNSEVKIEDLRKKEEETNKMK